MKDIYKRMSFEEYGSIQINNTTYRFGDESIERSREMICQEHNCLITNMM